MGVVVLRRMVIAAILVVGLGTAGWFLGLPRYRPEISDAQMFGIDVSSEQDDIDWTLVPSSGVSFAYLQASDGSTLVDQSFTANQVGAKAAGVQTGAVHRYSLCAPGEEQAAAFLAAAAPNPDDLPPAVRIEESDGCSRPLAPEVVLREVQAFLSVVEVAHNREAVLYVQDGFDYLEAVTSSRRAWRRSLFRGPVQSDWTLWQFHNRASVEGINGAVTLNIGNVDQLRD